MKIKTQIAILFADIVGSTSLYERLGNSQAQKATSNCLKHISSLIQAHQGILIKNIGDEIMCTFQSAEMAGNAAITIQESLYSFQPLPNLSLKVKIGLHFGTVIIENKDVFGDAVNLAARMTSQAKAQQIITTKETLMRMPKNLQLSSRQLNSAEIKGKTNPIQLYELTWGEISDLTITGTALHSPVISPNSSLNLDYRDKTTLLDIGSPKFTIGRDSDSSFVITDPLISRHHAVIEHQTSGFIITDLSTNGTYVTNTQGEEQFLHRNAVNLDGCGYISLGRKMTPDSSSAIHYDANFLPEIL